MMMARLSLLKCLPRLASMATFLCLIVVQWECPDMAPPQCGRLGARSLLTGRRLGGVFATHCVASRQKVGCEDSTHPTSYIKPCLRCFGNGPGCKFMDSLTM